MVIQTKNRQGNETIGNIQYETFAKGCDVRKSSTEIESITMS